MDPMQVSVIIPSKDQWPRLRLVLYGLTRQEGAPPFEVVIIDDASSQPIQELVAVEPGTFVSLNLRIIRHEKNKGRSAARNTGVAEARGVYCLFLDGDALPDRGKYPMPQANGTFFRSGDRRA
jgi:glycosyltransferase involved in cell wall biosynthesis